MAHFITLDGKFGNDKTQKVTINVDRIVRVVHHPAKQEDGVTYEVHLAEAKEFSGTAGAQNTVLYLIEQEHSKKTLEKALGFQ